MGSHPDIYIFDYHVFHSNVSDDNFDVPALCLNENRATTGEIVFIVFVVRGGGLGLALHSHCDCTCT
jgi:hypothetical protein